MSSRNLTHKSLFSRPARTSSGATTLYLASKPGYAIARLCNSCSSAGSEARLKPDSGSGSSISSGGSTAITVHLRYRFVNKTAPVLAWCFDGRRHFKSREFGQLRSFYGRRGPQTFVHRFGNLGSTGGSVQRRFSHHGRREAQHCLRMESAKDDCSEVVTNRVKASSTAERDAADVCARTIGGSALAARLLAHADTKSLIACAVPRTSLDSSQVVTQRPRYACSTAFGSAAIACLLRWPAPNTIIGTRGKYCQLRIGARFGPRTWPAAGATQLRW